MKITKTKIDLGLATGSLLAQKLVNYVVIAVMARYIDKGEMGQFFLASAIAVVISSATDSGLGFNMIRGVAASRWRARVLLSDLVSMRIPLGITVHLLTLGVVYLWRPDMMLIMVLVSIFTILMDQFYSFSAFLLAHRRMGSRTLAFLCGTITMVIGVIAAGYYRLPLPAVLCVYIAANGLMLLIGVTLVVRLYGGIRLHWRPKRFIGVVRGSFLMSVNAMLSIVIYKTDTIMLGALIGDLAVAKYESAYKLFEVSRIVVRPALMVFFPVASAYVAAGMWPELRVLKRKLFATACGIGVLMAVGVGLFATPVMVLAYGATYESSGPVLRVLFMTTPFLYIAFVATFMANALRAERRVMTALLACLAINLGLNAIVIPMYGAVGAAWATMASEVALCVMLLLIVRRWIARKNDELAEDSENPAAMQDTPRVGVASS